MKKSAKQAKRAAIDWERVKAKLATESFGEYSAVDLDAIFAQRAETLARVGQQREHKRLETHLACKLGSLSILLPLEYVLRIIVPQRVARVPGAPPVLGQIMQVDGKIVAIADLSGALGTEAPVDDARRFVVLVGEGPQRLGLLVHAVHGLLFVDERAISPASGHATAAADFVLGLSPELALVLDAQRLIHGLKAHAAVQSLQGAAL